jgi:hypothetical protein
MSGHAIYYNMPLHRREGKVILVTSFYDHYFFTDIAVEESFDFT